MTISQEHSSPICIEPAMVQAEDIPALYDGMSRPEFNEHLAKCQFCQSEAQEYRQVAGALGQRLSRPVPAARANCPESQLISDYLLNMLELPRRTAIKTHLSTCPYCPLELARFEIEMKAEQQSVRPSRWADSLQNSLALTFRKVVAQLVPRSFQPALRGGSDESESAIFQVEDVSVILQMFPIGPRKGDLTVTGIVARENLAGEALAGTEVSLREGTEVIAVEELDLTANFLFELENLDAELEHSLEIKFSDLLVVVPLNL